ncbi:sarcosine oxidase subunit gamma [Sesbania bispinosa]|nr:sarcosine oxidase subunit gamma [Sesbania bispinosa]
MSSVSSGVGRDGKIPQTRSNRPEPAPILTARKTELTGFGVGFGFSPIKKTGVGVGDVSTRPLRLPLLLCPHPLTNDHHCSSPASLLPSAPVAAPVHRSFDVQFVALAHCTSSLHHFLSSLCSAFSAAAPIRRTSTLQFAAPERCSSPLPTTTICLLASAIEEVKYL